MTAHMGIDTSYEVGIRDFSILKTNVQIYYVNGLVDDLTVGELTKVLVSINDNEPDTNSAYKVIKNRLNNLQVETIQSMDEAVDQILSGLIVIFIDGYDDAFVVDLRSYPGRQPEEPDRSEERRVGKECNCRMVE